MADSGDRARLEGAPQFAKSVGFYKGNTAVRQAQRYVRAIDLKHNHVRVPGPQATESGELVNIAEKILRLDLADDGLTSIASLFEHRTEWHCAARGAPLGYWPSASCSK